MSSILVVDDSALVRKHIGLLLKGLGHQYNEANNGLVGLEAALSESFDLIIVDLNMPKMDGFLFCRELRKFEELRETPVVMISADHRADNVHTALWSGANIFLPKPLQTPAVTQVLNLFL